MPMTPEQQIERVRQICLTFPETVERPSHGEPTFFVRGKKCFAMFANNHHGDGRIAVWLPASPGLQELLVNTQPETFFQPPYVGVRGWIGIELSQISDEDLQFYIRSGWFGVAPKNLQAQFNNINQ